MQPTACKLSLKTGKNDIINSPPPWRTSNKQHSSRVLPQYVERSLLLLVTSASDLPLRTTVLFSSVWSSMLQVAINNIHWWVDRQWSIVTCTSSSHRSIRSVNLLIARAFTPDSGWESRLSLPYLHSTPPLAGPRLNIAITFGVENYTVSQKV